MALRRPRAFLRAARALTVLLVLGVLQQGWAVASMVSCAHQSAAFGTAQSTIAGTASVIVDAVDASDAAARPDCPMHVAAGAPDESPNEESGSGLSAHTCAACAAGAAVSLASPALKPPQHFVPSFLLPAIDSPARVVTRLDRPPKFRH
jgi:hypothetical protein